MMSIILDKELLLSVTKPARYIGGEIGSVVKDWSGVQVKVALCFPDVYEIGMSHLGLRILYDILNKRTDCLAERVFAPWIDMEEKMRAVGMPLFSLESRRLVRDFDLLGFSLPYELCYTNVLNVLSMAGMPLLAAERDASFPLVIAGGASCLNPEPMADFIDAFVIGEAEEALGEVVDAYRSWKQGASGVKSELLVRLSRIPGVYVPSLYKSPARIVKRYVRDIEKVVDIDRWIVPFIEIVHDRIGVEIMRGCPGACRFCQARSCFYPLRVISKEKILSTVRRLYRQTGYEEISLLSLSSSDHPKIEEIVRDLLDEFRQKGVSVSLPSLRAKQVVGPLSEIFASMRKTSLTFAPEAGSERLRHFLGKSLTTGELFEAARGAYQAGYRLLKLYFMIGLPTETTADLDAIVDLCVELSRHKKGVDGHPARLNVSISNFVPKPQTPFQWGEMATVADLEAKQEYLRGAFKKHRGLIQLKFHRASASMVEGVLCRGDRALSGSIRRAFEAGARFDAWEHQFNDLLWQEAFRAAGVEPAAYLKKSSPGAPQPWEFIDAGPASAYFISEAVEKR